MGTGWRNCGFLLLRCEAWVDVKGERVISGEVEAGSVAVYSVSLFFSNELFFSSSTAVGDAMRHSYIWHPQNVVLFLAITTWDISPIPASSWFVPESEPQH